MQEKPHPTRRHFLQFIAGSPAPIFLSGLLGSSFLAACKSESNNTVAPKSIDYVKNSEEAAALVLMLAKQASDSGTFGVGGAMIENASGKVIKTMHNQVLVRLGNNLGPLSNTPYTQDPTAHGERQLISWYYQHVAALKLPPPEQLTIVTSLDPCAMCAGSITTAGFNAAVVAYDAYAGINYNEKANYPGLPSGIRQKLLDTFGFYGVAGGRQYLGAQHTLYQDTLVSPSTASGCLTVFEDSATQVRQSSSGSGLNPSNLADQMVDPALSPMKEAYTSSFADAFSIRLKNYRRPDQALKNFLIRLKNSTPNARNAVAFIDYYGNLLMASADRFDISPISTAFMLTVQQYSQLRFQFINDPQHSLNAQKSLTSPRYGTFVFLYAPSADDTTTLKDLGAYGSTMEGVIPVKQPSHFQYFLEPELGTIEDLRALIKAMPPFYWELVNINPQKVVV